MDFLGVGSGEILLVIIVALLLWGPGRIVEISRGLGKFIHSLKNTTSELTSQINKELEEQKKEEAGKTPNVEKP
jgi:sec-independent protein translocase protein TatA